MKQITTWSGLESYLMLVMEMALKDALVRIQQIYLEHIDLDVYRAGRQTNYYAYGTMQPTFGLRDSVSNKIVRKQKYHISGGIYHDEAKMILDQDNYVHGSPWRGGTDVRKALPEIINDGLSGNLFGPGWWQAPRPFITNTLQELQSNGTVRKIFLDVFKGMGIKAI